MLLLHVYMGFMNVSVDLQSDYENDTSPTHYVTQATTAQSLGFFLLDINYSLSLVNQYILLYI